jgi:hypothetical protein
MMGSIEQGSGRDVKVVKRFKLDSAEIRSLAPGHGSCLASDHITVEGRRVGYMYRESADNELDSGWRFFSGTESQEFADNPDKFAMYDVNTIANYDPSIIPCLDARAGSAWGRDEAGEFKEERVSDDVDK